MQFKCDACGKEKGTFEEADNSSFIPEIVAFNHDLVPSRARVICEECFTNILPEVMTASMKNALGTMIFSTAPIADVLRAGGHVINRKAEEEQAYMLFWFLKLVLAHGDDWKRQVGLELQRVENKLKEKV